MRRRFDVARRSPRGVTHAVDVDGDGRTLCGVYPRASTRTMQSRPQVDCERCRVSLIRASVTPTFEVLAAVLTAHDLAR